MGELILNSINTLEKCSIQEIQDNLNLRTISIKDLKKILTKLCDEGKLFFNLEEDTYYKIGNEYQIGEILVSSKGHRYFIDENNKKNNISDEDLNGALTFSKVIIKRDGKNYKVVKVLQHKNDKIVCEVNDENDKKTLKSMNTPNGYLIHINKQTLKRLADGDRILVKVGTEFENNYLYGDFIKIICHRNEPNKELLSIAYSKDFDPEFTDEALKELENIPDTVLENELIGREDFRNEEIFTIDGVNTKDMDDAISLKILDNGNYELGVHIADVAHYVKNGMKLFEEARERATSLYMIESVIPMLPQKLSNGICSLNPNVDRLTKSCIMEIDKHGKIVNSKVVSSVINSNKKMDYDSVNYILENGIIKEGYEKFYDTLMNMKKLAQILNQVRTGQGKLDFVNNEIEVKTDEFGKPLEFSFAHQGEAEHLIENFMIVANETIASYFSELPFVYRVHGIPSEIKLDKTINFITGLGYRVNTCGNVGSPKLIQNILNSLSDKEEFPLLSNLLLRSMKKAEYSINNIGHFGLALDNYTHFTSPIRRFPDLQVHALIDLYNSNFNKINLKEMEKYLATICAHSSYKERQADAAEEESKKLMMLKYIEEHLGETFEGIIVSIEGNYVRVRTNDLIYGQVDLPEKGNHSLKNIVIGTKVLLRAESVCPFDKSIHFNILEKINEANMQKKKILSI